MSTLHLVVMGVSGTGKSTVGLLLAQDLNAVFADADDFHPAANVEKMRSGTPLTDADREPWLAALSLWQQARAEQRESTVLACSALRRHYRDVLRTGLSRSGFVHLVGPPWLLEERMGARPGHFMPASLLASQLATLEPLAPDEVGIVLDVREPASQLAADAARWARALPASS